MTKVILLGSSNSLIQNPMGDKIDEFDVIWRTNHTGHPKSIEKYPEILGSKHGNWYIHDIPYSIFDINNNVINSKTDIITINKYISIIHNLFDVEFERLKRVGHIMEPKGRFKGIYNNCNKQEVFKIQEDNFINSNRLCKSNFNNLYFGYFNWIRDCYNILEKNNIKIGKPPKQKPSSGMRMLTYLLKQYEHIHIMGFNGGSTGHWYTSKNIDLNYHPKSDYMTTVENRFGKGKHYLDAEYQFMKILQQQGKVTIL
jgi:hypothetical protein